MQLEATTVKQSKATPVKQLEATTEEIIDLFDKADSLLGDPLKAYWWFHTPIPALDDATPWITLHRPGGVKRISVVLAQLEHGV